jgi:PAS domain S-box-containing protein
VCRQLRDDPATARIPILHVTATEKGPAEEVRGLEGGADGYLVEPVDPGVLVASIRTLLRARAAEKELAAQLADLKYLVELTARVARSMDLRDVLGETLAAVTHLLGTAMGNVLLYDPERKTLSPAASLGLTPEYLKLIERVELGAGSCGAAFVRKAQLIVEDVETDPLYAPFLAASRVGGYRAVFSTPLLSLRGEALGTIAVFFREPHRPSERECRMTELYARQAGQAIENARLYSEAEQGRRVLEALMENVPEGITILDAEGNVRMMSRCGLELFGQTAAGAAGRPYREIFAGWRFRGREGAEPAPFEQLLSQQALGEGRAVNNEQWTAVRPDGRELSLLMNAVPIRDAAGGISGYVVSYHDITEHTTIELRLRETQRLESVGLLAAGVAHDFNNLLTSVMGGASLAWDLLDQSHPAADLLEDVLRSSERAAHLTGQLLAYSGRGRFVVRPLDLSEAVRQMTPLVRNAVPSHVTLDFTLGAGLPPAKADSGQLQQLLLNLVMNAAEAIGENHGTVTVSTGVQHWEGGVDVAGELPAGRYVFLEVRDDGCGISPEVRPRIFEPFFTTKFVGRGLGLPAALGIARGHLGGLQVVTAPGEGSTFRVLIPAIAPEAGAASKTILVVDDEELVARVAQTALERAGYQVCVAHSGRQALEIFEGLKCQIAAIVLDLKMPGMSGSQLLEQLRAIRPDIRVLIATAYEEEEAFRQVSGRVSGFIHKPFTPALLRGELERVLEQDG